MSWTSILLLLEANLIDYFLVLFSISDLWLLGVFGLFISLAKREEKFLLFLIFQV